MKFIVSYISVKYSRANSRIRWSTDVSRTISFLVMREMTNWTVRPLLDVPARRLCSAWFCFSFISVLFVGDLAWLNMKPSSLLNSVAAEALNYIFRTFDNHHSPKLTFR